LKKDESLDKSTIQSNQSSITEGSERESSHYSDCSNLANSSMVLYSVENIVEQSILLPNYMDLFLSEYQSNEVPVDNPHWQVAAWNICGN
jgi:hypothetical protein